MEDTSTEDAVVLAPGTTARSVLPTLYAGAIVVAALYYGQELMVPLVLAALLAFVLAPACRRLQKLRLPRVLAVLLVVLMTFALIGGLGTIVARQGASLAESLPQYSATIGTKWNSLVSGVGHLEQMTKTFAPSSTQTTKKSGGHDEGIAAPLGLDMSGMSIARTLAQPLLAPLATGGIVFIFTIFILLSQEDLRDRLVRLVGRQDLHRTILAMNDAASRLSRYFLFQLALNSVFGVVIGVCLGFAGLPNPLLWGILAAVMRFVPFVGVVIALVPPLLLAVAVVPGWSLAILVLALFAGAETLMGQVVEPLIYGHSTGLSPLAVIVATAFWALIWGPVGLLIATPLTVCLVVIGRHVAPLAFLDVILGDSPPLEPPETFYQRALEGQATMLLPDARKRIAATSLVDYYDKVALPGLALAQDDLFRDALAFERLESIHEQIHTLLAPLAASASPRAGGTGKSPPPPDWRRDGAVICVPGRGQLDDLAARMAVQGLSRSQFGARVEPNMVLGSSAAMPADMARAKLCCLSVLENGTTVAGVRFFIKRMQKQLPGTIIVIGLWHAGRDSPLLAALRAAGTEEHLVLSVGELLAYCNATAARAVQPAL